MKPYIWFRFLVAVSRAQQLRDRLATWLRHGPWLNASDEPPLPQRGPLGDYVPEEWVAEYRRQDRGQP